jgi:hypothetical protein
VVVSDLPKREGLATRAHPSLHAGAPLIALRPDRGRPRCRRLAYPSTWPSPWTSAWPPAEGLGTCWIGSFDPAQVRRILGIPPEVQVVGLMLLGYPRESTEQPKKSRLPLEQIVHREAW